jgi:hypothetical protein
MRVWSQHFTKHHRWMADSCRTFQAASKVCLSQRGNINASIAELHRCAKVLPLAIFVYAPYQFPLDHPDFEPVWKTAADYDLSTLHTFTVMPPCS